ncbi:MAG: phosphoenolpyruvate carboxylase [Methanosarcinales archaeon]
MKFPKVMCTQHPDSASRYLSTQEELEEAVEGILKYGCDEYMPDYEGKTTPYHQNVQILEKLFEETNVIPGLDVFLTPRVPSAHFENRFRQLMVMMSAAEANSISQEYSDVQAITELVHPMTTNIDEIIESQQHAIDVFELAKKEFKVELKAPQIIPLVEDVPALLNIEYTIKQTLLRYQKHFQKMPDKYRVFIGKSDSALFFGHLASALACKHAIHSLCSLDQNIDTQIGIIFGGGALPFRGHVTLENADNLFTEYAGIDTITLQSGIRYDHAEDDAKILVKLAKKELSKKPELFSEEESNEIINIIGILGAQYLKTISQIPNLINCVADLLPNQRDRLMRIGSLGYSREIPELEKVVSLCKPEIREELLTPKLADLVNLPRAIKFTGALYSIGLPPEFIGTGIGIHMVKKLLGEEALERLLTKYYPSIEADLTFAARFLNLKVASEFLPPQTSEKVHEDLTILSDFFNILSDKEKENEFTYHILMEMIKPNLLQVIHTEDHKLDDEPTRITKSTLIKMGKIRRSLG